jgi:vacuolar-type H+-ATPase subunit H
VTDNRMKDRMKGLLGGVPIAGEAPEALDVAADGGASRQALQVLTLAQRTADDHVADAHRQAEKIHRDAQAAAEQVVREAQTHAHGARYEADQILAGARDAAAQMAQDSRASSHEAQRNADKILSDAQADAEAVAAEVQAEADDLRQQAEQRYQDVVGSLAAKRAALQEQIEALELFDRDYRGRLMTFMQGQLRALWADQPRVEGDIDPFAAGMNGGEPAHRQDPAVALEHH